MKLKIKRIDKSLELPEYKTKGAVGFDLTARVETVVKPFEVTLIPLNIVVKVPKGYSLLLFSRSSTPGKKGLMVANGVGVIDWDYSGEEDEVKLAVLNFTKKQVKVEKGERIAQALIVKVLVPKFLEVKKMDLKSRGGFGSTG
ncbi:MAG: dUTP diphosphatase [Patescibacteria group bacterium]